MTRLAALALALLGALAAGPARAQEAPQDAAVKALADEMRPLDEKLLSALRELAEIYDAKKDPEAAAFFCECALGLGPRDEKLEAIRKKWEDELYTGRVRGGKPLEDTSDIESRLVKLGETYRGILERGLAAAVKVGPPTPESVKEQLARAALRSELGRGAHEYVRAVQNFNAVRAKMKLRALLWDFGASSKLILGGWYMGETRDWGWGKTTAEFEKRCHESPAHSDAVLFARRQSIRYPHGNASHDYRYALSEFVYETRSQALTRTDLLNPDARRLWLGHWRDGKHEITTTVKLYCIPREVYRQDVETPSGRYSNSTKVQARDNWTDVEEVVRVGDVSAVVSHYPYADEDDAPQAFGDGDRSEQHWDDEPEFRPGRWGVPIMLRIFAEAQIGNLNYDLREASGHLRQCRVYLNGDKRVDLGKMATILLIPEKRLDFDTTYTVSIKCKVNGTPYAKKWTFKTRKRPVR